MHAPCYICSSLPFLVAIQSELQHRKFLNLQILNKKIDTLTKALEAEYKKIKREAATKEKNPISTKVDDKIKITNSSKRYLFSLIPVITFRSFSFLNRVHFICLLYEALQL